MTTALLSIATAHNTSTTTTPSCSSNTLAALAEYCSSSDSENCDEPSTEQLPTHPTSSSLGKISASTSTPILADIVMYGNRFQGSEVQERMKKALRPSARSGFTATTASKLAAADAKEEEPTPQAQAQGEHVAERSFEIAEIVSSTRPIYEGLPASTSSKSPFLACDESMTERFCSTPIRPLGLGLLEIPYNQDEGGALGLLSQSPLHHLRPKTPPKPIPVIAALAIPTTPSLLRPGLPSSLSFDSLAQLEEGRFRSTTNLNVTAKLTRYAHTRHHSDLSVGPAAAAGFLSVRQPTSASASRRAILSASRSVASMWEPKENVDVGVVGGAAGSVSVAALKGAFGVVGRVFSAAFRG